MSIAMIESRPRSLRRMLVAAGLLAGAGAYAEREPFWDFPRATYRRPPGNSGIKAYRAKRRRKNRIASRSRARNRT